MKIIFTFKLYLQNRDHRNKIFFIQGAFKLKISLKLKTL